MGLRVIMWGSIHKRMGTLLWEKLTAQDTIKDFDMGTGGLDWMKWLKNEAGKSLHFMQLFPHYILFGENFIGEVKVPLYSVCLNLNHEKTK